MDQRYRESRPIMPRNLSTVLAAVLLATVAFMALSNPLMGTSLPAWMVGATAAVSLLIIVLCFGMRLTVTVTDSSLDVSYAVRKASIPLEDILDKKTGDLSQVKHYSSWSLKGVKHKAYTALGEDMGVAFKVRGMRVVVVSSADPEALAAAVPINSE